MSIYNVHKVFQKLKVIIVTFNFCSVLRWREFDKGAFKENPLMMSVKHTDETCEVEFWQFFFLNKILSHLEKHNYPS
jgi:hypothetical protein